MRILAISLALAALVSQATAAAQETKWKSGNAAALLDDLEPPTFDLSLEEKPTFQSAPIGDGNASLDTGFFESPALNVPGAQSNSFSGLRIRLPIDGP